MKCKSVVRKYFLTTLLHLDKSLLKIVNQVQVQESSLSLKSKLDSRLRILDLNLILNPNFKNKVLHNMELGVRTIINHLIFHY